MLKAGESRKRDLSPEDSYVGMLVKLIRREDWWSFAKFVKKCVFADRSHVREETVCVLLVDSRFSSGGFCANLNDYD